MSGERKSTSEQTSEQASETYILEGEALQKALKKWDAVRLAGENHELLRRMVGDWKVALKFYGGQPDSAWESRCESTKSLIHEGRFLLDRIEGQMMLPGEHGEMTAQPYSGTILLGFDNYKKSFVGTWIDTQNTHMLSFRGPPGPPRKSAVTMYGLVDEPMLELHDTTMKYVLQVTSDERHSWQVFALSIGENAKVIELDCSRK